MQTTELNAVEERIEDPTSCRVVVVYEDVPTQKLALTLSDHMRAHFDADLDFDFSWWNLRFLGDGEIARAAHREARSADVILFSLNPGSDLPVPVKSWIESWLPERLGQTGALAVVMEPGHGEDDWRREVQTYLATVAQRAEMDFLVLAGTVRPGPAGRFQTGPRMFPAPGTAAPYPDASSHWGINE